MSESILFPKKTKNQSDISVLFPKNNHVTAQISEAEQLQQQHPLLFKLAEKLQGTPGLETAGKIGSHIENIVAGTGLPNLVRGFLQSGTQPIRGLANLIPGVNIPDPKFSEMPIAKVNPKIQNTMELLGSLLSGGSLASKGFQTAQTGLNLLPGASYIPQALKNIGAGATIGSIMSPDNRYLGVGIGAGLTAAPEAIKAVLPKKLDNPFYVIQKAYDTKENALSNIFNNAAQQVKKDPNIGRIPIANKVFEEIKEFGPNTKAFKDFLSKAKENSDFNTLRKLQSELWKRGTKMTSSNLISEQDMGHRVLELRDDINNAISDHLKSKGRTDIASDIQKAMSGWHDLMDTYHSNKTISKLVGPDRKVPSTQNILKQESTQLNMIRDQHPEIKAILKKQNQNELIKKILQGTAIGAGIYGTHEGIKALLD